MMKAADAAESDHFSHVLDGSRDGCVSAECHVRTILVVIGDMLADETEQMALAEHDHVIEQLAPQCPHPTFREAVLQGDLGAVFSCSIPMCSIRALKAAP